VQSGHATLTGSTLTITGAGDIVVVANQPGDDSWFSAAPVARTFSVRKITLNVTADDKSSVGGQALQTLTSTIAGFVNGDQPSVVTGAPALSTTATGNGEGSFPINVAIGTLAAANYTFNLIPGTYSVTAAPRVPDGVVKLTTTTTITKTDGLYHIVVTVANSGSSTAQNVVLTSAKLNGAAGAPTPQSMGNIPPRGSATVSTTFGPSAGISGAAGIEQVVGTYTGGTFGGSYRAVLP
jgi:hypothetical protein